MAAIKTTFVLLLLAFAMVVVTEAQYTHVCACDEVCQRSSPERDECCRAHGFSGSASCSRGMHCY
ncbi:hypothetical protein ABMA28_016143 [Loxostege sticticalis]|uniref:Uncharacterized protein n=1 Tax=Loxostege sticticalis TaxID=481309 RepID=A0ABD0T816_LOXSC